MSDIFWPRDDDSDGQRFPTGGGAAGGYGGFGGYGDGGYSPTEPQPQPGPEPQRRGRRTGGGLIAAVAVTALVFGGIGVGVGSLLVGNGGSGGTDSATGSLFNTATSASDSHGSRQVHSVADIAAQVLPSVVSITVVSPQESDTGSGVVLRQDGYILTNNHVVAAGAGGVGRMTVTFNDGSTASAHIVGTDAEDDLAVIKADKSGLQPATLGTSSDLRVGDAVIAVGSPLGLQGTVTSGIVSALNRPVEASDSGQPQGFFGQRQASQPVVYNAIQTDAAINPGNSGGPLVDSSGDVVGIDSAIATVPGSSDPFGGSGQSGNIGVGFAIPIDQAKIIAAELMKNGKATHPLLGVTLTDATDQAGNALARVQSVQSGSPAAHAGLKPGDIITRINGHPTPGADAVIATIRSYQPGQQVTITWTQGAGGSTHTATVTLADASSAQG
jgi:putative serine protease PepD